ncbi:MAG: Mur ligase family protein, partial [Oscillospiraceae bacterium]
MTILKKVEDAIDYIHNLPRLGSQLSLSRIKELLELMGNPQDELKFVHIAGTNGKGTMASMCSMALTNAGYITGTYTSPFITEFRERFRVNGKMIKRPVLLKIAKSMMPHIEILEKKEIFVTEFEFITALAFEFFKLEKCEIVCLEVGIGGKFDSTNVIKTPEVAVLTSISYDHTDLLGDTLTQIANKKCGIIKENTAVVTVPFQEKEVIEVITKKCNETSSELIIPDVKNI